MKLPTHAALISSLCLLAACAYTPRPHKSA